MSYRNTIRSIIRWILPGLCLLLCGASYACYERTLVVWWWPLAAALAVALLPAPRTVDAWRHLTGSEDRLLNFACHLLVVGSCTLFALLGGNYLLADPATTYEEEVLVETRTHDTRQQYRTLRHHRRVPAGKRDLYYLHLRFADGTRKRLQVSRSHYNSTREGGRLVLTLRRGLLGFPVIRGGHAALQPLSDE